MKSITVSKTTPPLISVVVSCCNVAPWLPMCIASLRNQTFANFDVTFYVETSTDATVAIVQAACEQDERFSMVEGPRSGSASAARNWGIHHARGTYVWNVDGDDWVTEDALAFFAECVAQAGEAVDGVFAAFQLWQDGTPPIPLNVYRIPEGAGKTYPSGLTYCQQAHVLSKVFYPGLQHFIFKRTVAHDLGFEVPHGRRHQDSGWTYRLLLNAKRVVVSDHIVYYYRDRVGSVTKRPNPQSVYDNALNCFDLLTYYATLDSNDPRREQLSLYFRKTLFRIHPLGGGYNAKGQMCARYKARDCKRAWQMIFQTPTAKAAYQTILKDATAGQRLEFLLMQLAQWPGCFTLMRTLIFKVWLPLRTTLKRSR